MRIKPRARLAILSLLSLFCAATVSAQVATPLFSASGMVVTITSPTAGATICYTLNGSTPAASVAGTCDAGSTSLTNGGTVTEIYGTPVVINALGTKVANTNSPVSSSPGVQVNAVFVDGQGHVSTTAYLNLQLWNCGNNPAQVLVNPQVIIAQQFVMRANSSGIIQGLIYGNNQISCGGIESTQWLISGFKNSSTQVGSTQQYYILASPGTFDPSVNQPSTANPLTPGFTVLFGDPIASETWAQPTGTKGIFEGVFDFTNATVLGIGGGPGGGITTINTPSGSGLTGGGTTATLTLGLETDCTNGQVLAWNSGTNKWGCSSTAGGNPPLNAIANATANTGIGTGAFTTTFTEGDFGASPVAGAFVLTDTSTSATDTSAELYINVPNTSYHQGLNISVDGFAQLQICSLGASHVGITVIGNILPCTSLPTTTKTWIMDNSASHTGLTIYQNNSSPTADMLQLNNVGTSGFNFLTACSGTKNFAGGGNGTCPNSTGQVVARVVSSGELDLIDTIDPNVFIWTVNTFGLPALSVGQSGIGVDTIANGGGVKCNSNGGGWLSCGSGGGGAVSSVFTRSGAVVATAGDYSLSQITGFTVNSAGFSIAGGSPTSKTLTVDNSLELAGTDSTKMTFPTTNAVIARTDASQTFTGTQFVGSSAPSPTIGSAGGDAAAEGSGYTGLSAVDGWYASSSNHCLDIVNQTVDVGCALTTSAGLAANGAIVLQAGIDATTTGASASLTLRGEDVTGGSTASIGGGAAILRGGNTASTGGATTGGAATHTGGNCTNTSGSCTPGVASVTAGGFTGAFTNGAGVDTTIAGGLGTGNAAVSHVKLQSPALSQTSGTTAQTQVTRWVAHVKAGSTTTATATNMFNVAMANNQTAGFLITVHVETTQATPHNCSTTQTFLATVQETSGTVTQQTTAGPIATICDTGTLTLAAAMSTAAPSVFSVTPSWATIAPSAVTITIEVQNLSQQEITLL